MATDASTTTLSADALKTLLWGDYAPLRQDIYETLADERFFHQPGADTEIFRQRVYEWCKILADKGYGAFAYPESSGGDDDYRAAMIMMQVLGSYDLSLTIKFGVQFGLFGGSIHMLGTKYHHDKYLSRASTLELPGCFAMTETGHGSNVRDIETVASYDRATESFILHTPTNSARKDYIGNVALHGQQATVFAQLEIDGEGFGVHAFCVAIRDADGNPLEGVRIEDCGEKLGLNGVDNGRLWFDHVRVPRAELLNRFANVSPDGEYSSPIKSQSRRFFTMLGTLVGGRVGVPMAGLNAAKTALTIAVRYGAKRRQFGEDGEPETVLLDYRTHQRRLMPLIANTYALEFALSYLLERYVNKSEDDIREVEALAAGLKAYATWNTTDTIQICREACGGVGYLAENRFAALKADSDVFTTFEGDNTVLMQLVAKSLLTEYKDEFNNFNVLDMASYAATQAAIAFAELNPVVTRLITEDHLRDSDFHLSAFRYREHDLLTSLARRLRKRISKGLSPHDAMIRCQDHMVNLALAHVERVVLEQFVETVENCQDPALKPTLKNLCDLFALWHMEKNKGWYLEHNYMEGMKTKAIRRQINRLCWEIRADAVTLVDGFGLPDHVIAAPIAVSEDA